MKKILIAVLIVLVLAGAGLAYYLYQKPVESLREAKSEQSMTSEELYSSFEADESAANEKFTGAVITVEGELVEILENSDQSSTLILSSTHPIFGVKCRLNPKDNPTAIPPTGNKVRIKGLCTGFNSDVEMDQCIILN